MTRFSLQLLAMSLAGAGLLSFSAAAQVKGSGGAKTEKQIRFEVLSIHPLLPGANLAGMTTTVAPTPNGYRSTLSIWHLIELGYAPEFNMVSGIRQTVNRPAWSGDLYNVDARVSSADLEAWQKQGSQHELLRAAVRAALKERFKLAIHEQPSVAPILELVTGKNGPRLKEAAPVTPDLVGIKLPGGGVCVATRLKGQNPDQELLHFYGANTGDLIWFLARLSPTIPIRDRTGLTGRYDFTLQQIDEPSQSYEDRVNNYPIGHLGLRLKPSKEDTPILVIDHIEKPTAN
jgi:uncharacterized protein (TIGR03435 family)